MHRTTIMLPRALKAKAERQAKRRGVSLGQYIREAVEKQVAAPEPSAPADDAFFNPPVFHDEGPADVADRHDDYLYGDRVP